MRIIKINIILSCLIVFQIDKINSQCYTMLTDLSGMTSNANSLLEEASCALADSFPGEAFRDSFGVYDFGFYLQTENMGGQANIDAIFDEMESRVSHPFYMIFGRKSDPNGIYTQLFVRFKFPAGIEPFECLVEDDLANYKLFLPAFLNEQYAILQNTPDNASLAIKETINKFTEFVMEKRECCVTGFINSCDNCMTADQIISILNSKGFATKKAIGMTITERNLVPPENSHLKAYGNFIIDFAINAKTSLEDHITEAEKIITPIEIELQVVEDRVCLIDLEFPEKAPTGKFNKLYVFGIKSGDEHYVSSKLIPGQLQDGPRKIHLIESETNSGFNIGNVTSSLQSFIAICGCAPPQIVGQIPFTYESLRRRDIIFFIGNGKNKVINFISTSYKDKVSEGYLKYTLPRWLANVRLNPEVTDGERNCGVVEKSSCLDFANSLNESLDRTAAFICLHSIGHMASDDFSHFDENEFGLFYQGNGFMSSGGGIVALMTSIYWTEASPGGIKFDTFENLITGVEKPKEANSTQEKQAVCKYFQN